MIVEEMRNEKDIRAIFTNVRMRAILKRATLKKLLFVIHFNIKQGATQISGTKILFKFNCICEYIYINNNFS